jgi:hypothetical protein
MSKFCSECGALIIDEDTKFCSHCGARLPEQKTIKINGEFPINNFKDNKNNKLGEILFLIIVSSIFYVFSTFFIPYGEGVLLIKSTGIMGGFTEFGTILGYFCLTIGWLFRISPAIAVLIIIYILIKK